MTSFLRAARVGIAMGLALISWESAQAADEAPSGPVAWWKMDGNLNGVPDAAGDLNGTLHQFFPSPFVTGLFNEALLFSDGAYVSFSSGHDALDLKSFTLSAWLKVDYAPKETALVEWSDGNNRWILGVTSEGTAQIKFIQSSQVQTVTGGKDSLYLAGQTWHHLAIAYDAEASKATLYVDDFPEGEATITGWTPSAAQSFFFGNPIPASMPCYFALDEVKLYSRALSLSEIGQLASAYKDANGNNSNDSPPTTASSGAGATTSSSDISSTNRPVQVDESKVGHYIYVSIANGANDHDGLSPVAANGHGPKASIRAAIDAAVSGDTIIILSGTYAESIPDTGSKHVTFCPEGKVILR